MKPKPQPAPPASDLHKIVSEAHDIAETTRDRYLRDLDQWIKYVGSDPINWTRKNAASFYGELIGRMKPQSANRLMASLAYASRWWAHYEGNDGLDFARVQLASPKDKKIQSALDEESARKLLETCDSRTAIGARDFALIVTMLETGMRRISIVGMQIEDTIFEASPRWPYPATFVPLKGKAPDWVPLSDTALMALGLWYRHLAALSTRGPAQLSGPTFRPFVRYAHTGRQCPMLTTEMKPLSMSAIAKIFDERAKAAGLDHINPHRLRHTHVTWRTQQGLTPLQIASVTHHDIKREIGVLGDYGMRKVIGGQVRNSTPPWLAELVRSRST